MKTENKVFITPFGEQNSYQSIMKEYLEKKEVEVIPDRNHRPYAIFYRMYSKGANILHLHWIDSFYMTEDDNKIKNAAAAMLFVANLILVKLFSDKTVWTMHNLRNHEGDAPHLDRLMRSRIVPRFCDKVQVWDENTKNMAIEELSIEEEKLEIVPHGNYLPVYEQYDFPDQEKARAKLGIPQEVRVYLFFGQIRPYKQVDKLIEVFKDESNEDEFLLIAGNPMNDRIEENLREIAAKSSKIKFDFGFVSEEEVPKYFSASDICVFPYKHIFNSGSVILAMGFGKPVLAPDKGAIQTILGEDFIYNEFRSGFKKIQSLHCKKIKNSGYENRRRAIQNLSWRKLSSSINSLYSS
ncbi:glycosyltransferase [Nanohaloarchaea archaeon H01]|nr:glycosyltransferase [Nanohaloarchaea archaeon H01]